jgi:DNA-binding response OmpR family regulator
MKTIMIVVSNPDVSSTIGTLLKKNGYRVTVAFNADECLEKLKNGKPDLILIEGVGIIARTKILETVTKLKKIKVAYLITDESETENLKLYGNVIGFIDEPTNINEFLKKIRGLMG